MANGVVTMELVGTKGGNDGGSVHGMVFKYWFNANVKTLHKGQQ